MSIVQVIAVPVMRIHPEEDYFRVALSARPQVHPAPIATEAQIRKQFIMAELLPWLATAMTAILIRVRMVLELK